MAYRRAIEQIVCSILARRRGATIRRLGTTARPFPPDTTRHGVKIAIHDRSYGILAWYCNNHRFVTLLDFRLNGCATNACKKRTLVQASEAGTDE